jgi:hypothetical protein
MRSLLLVAFTAAVLLLRVGLTAAQSPGGVPAAGVPPPPSGTPTAVSPPVVASAPVQPAGLTLSEGQPLLGAVSAPVPQGAAPAAAQQPGDMQKRMELLEKQIAVQQKMIQVMLEQLKKLGSADVEEMQGKVASLEARSKQAAQRDQDVAQAIDNLTEHLDAEERNGPRLPATLKELFLPMRTNETPVSIYGSFVENFTHFNAKPGVFSSPDFAPFFFVQLNNNLLLAASIDINNSGVSVGEAQINWFATDWLTVVLGRYLTPIGFFNERLNHEWINRLPDPALMFRQVSPLTSTDGIMLRGGFYLGCTPIKLEYEVYGGNGLQAAAAPTTVSQVADLENITGGPDETNIKAFGGRLGFWLPEWGLTGGASMYFNGRYSSAASDQFNLWQLDLGYRKGNWDCRFEYAENYQQAASYVVGNNIRRWGFYTQVAYRPYHLEHCILRNLEGVVRYSRVWFNGINPNLLDTTVFASLVDVPVNRDQWTLGVNYYFYPSMALRLAYEINHEFNGINLHDNVFLGQFVWAF